MGLLTNTTFIKFPPHYLQLDIPSIITQSASIATKNLGGQTQLSIRPKAKANEHIPLLRPKFLRIFYPPLASSITVYKAKGKFVT